ncbi:hypothetical protein IC582_004913 [Cucumis melo]|uniref:Filament-like plant protein 3 n=2 Tax=Cucumis melo TaxID=3656 RepID=A0A5A7V1Y1_CUCMM|nr:filament-like plant protein 3 [Cucumis melo var. makuwa]TYK24845.1 filament-like plant protein 3 [Cucumis melo var. makuwa]
MERRKWPWKRKSSDKSPGETESSGSMSSYSERFSDEQDAAKSSPNHETQSPEVTSKAICKEEDIDDDLPKQEEINDSVKSLSERLSAALVNVKAKEDLVKQHAKVAEEAIAGWEKAENEVTHLKQQLGTTVQQKSALENRVSHLDGALKECVRQLRQAREEQEQKIHDAVEEKIRDWESTKVDLERQLLALQSKADTAKCESPKVDPSIGKRLELLKRENAALRHELHAQYRELETRTIERDLSTQTAETASKQHLESIKKMAKLEAECRRLKFMSCKPSLVDHKSIAASTISIESLTDTQSDNGEQLSAVDIEIRTERNKGEPSCSHPRASTLLAELNQLGNEKPVSSNLPSSLELDLMDDFLEMERLASLPETDTGKSRQESEAFPRSTAEENALRTELEALRHERSLMEEKLGEMEEAKIELEEKLKQMEVEKDELEERLEMMEIERDEANQMLAKMETEQYKLGQELVKMEEEKVEMGEKLMKLETQKDELETALSRSQNSVELSQFQLKETQMKLEKLQNELTVGNESKLRIESQLISMEAESLTMSAKVEMLESDIQKERASAMALTVKCQVLEEELSRLKQDEKLSQSEISKNELKIKQEDLAVAAGKLAECQKTIASLGNQLKSLAALEDFLIDTTHLPEFTASESLSITIDGEEQCKHPYGTLSPKRDSDFTKVVDDNSEPLMSKNGDDSPPLSSSSTSSSMITSHVVNSEKNRNGFAKFFSRTKSGIKLEI